MSKWCVAYPNSVQAAIDALKAPAENDVRTYGIARTERILRAFDVERLSRKSPRFPHGGTEEENGGCVWKDRDYFTWLSASFTASMMALLVMVALATVSTSALFAATMAAGRASMALSPMPSVSF